jgi:hypothetical protein
MRKILVLAVLLVVFYLLPAGFAQPESFALLSMPAQAWSTNAAGAYRDYIHLVTNVVPPSLAMRMPPPTNLPPEIRRAMVTFLAQATTQVRPVTNHVFDHFIVGSLNHLVWTNFIARTNGKNIVIWSQRSHPADWPTNAPTVKWNPDSLIWGMKGMTAISPCWELEGSSGQVPITLLTRRHGYARGHSMGDDGFRTKYYGKKVWFLAADNTLVERRVIRDVVRTFGVARRDYCVLLFDRDLPDSVQPMRVIPATEVLGVTPTRYAYCPGAPAPVFKTEQTGHVSADIPGIPGFYYDTFKGGDSGSPNMLPMPGELIFYSGRSTSGPTHELQADMDALSRMEGLDPKRYQLRWADLSAFPSY